MKVIRSEYAGACYGVERALSLVANAAEESRRRAQIDSRPPEPVYTLGPLIHNPQVVDQLAQKGVQVAGSIDDVAHGVLVIRSHGVAPEVIEQARSKGLSVVDATCPHVSKAHRAAQQLRDDGYAVLVVGELGHPEVEGISAYADHDALVVQTAADLPDPLPSERIGIVVQTTQSAEALQSVVSELNARNVHPEVRNTICFATRQRQQAAQRLAREVDVMVVVGGRNSGNTTRLHMICQATGTPTYHIESPAELRPQWFKDADKVGVTAGASTPEDQIVTVVEALEAMQ